jgi:hypothetical protein
MPAGCSHRVESAFSVPPRDGLTVNVEHAREFAGASLRLPGSLLARTARLPNGDPGGSPEVSTRTPRIPLSSPSPSPIVDLGEKLASEIEELEDVT